VIKQSTVVITGGNLVVDSHNKSNIVTVGMGGAVVSGVFGLAGSVVVNSMSSEAHAKIVDNSVITVAADPSVANSGQVRVTGKDENSIISIARAGGLAWGEESRDRTGIGAAININVIKPIDGTLAIIEDSDVTADDQIIVTANTTNTLVSVTAALAAAANGMSAKSLAVAVSVTTNVVDTGTRASVRRKKNSGVSGKRGVTVDASDNSHVVTVSGGAALAGTVGGLAGSGRAVGASISFNYLDQDVTSDITAMPVASTEGSFAEYPEIGFTEPIVDSQTYLEDGIEFSTDGQWVLGLNQSLINDTLRVNEFFSTITDIRIASTNGVDTFQLKSVRIKDTLRETTVSVDVFGQSGACISSLSLTGGTDYQTVPITTASNLYFDIRTRTNQVIEEVVVNDGTNDITITFDGLTSGDATYTESGFTITNEGAPMQRVDGGVSDTVTNTVTVTSLDGAPFAVASVALQVVGTGSSIARNDFVDFIGQFAGGGSITQRVSAGSADGVVSAALVGFEDLASMTFRLPGESSARQVIQGLYLGNDQSSTILFDDYLAASRRHVEDGLGLVTDGTLVGYDLGGQVLGTARATEPVTHRSR